MECVKLLKTYDTTILDALPPSYKKLIAEWVKLYLLKYKHKIHNQVLLQLTYNHFFKQKPVFKYISGPLKITYHTSAKYNKRIYLIGERHVPKTCDGSLTIGIDFYLKKLIETTDVFVDLFLEIPSFDTKEGYKIQNFMLKVLYEI